MTTLPTLVLSQINESARGPTSYSHWVVPNLLLASAYPGEKDPDAHKRLTRQIIDAGIQVVVNIMEIEELKRFTPYQEIMLQHATEVDRQLEFISFPIRDQSVHQDNQRVLEFCLELCDRVKKGQVVLVHCWGGHGRTGTIISIMIGILFNLKSQEAISMNRQLHDQRIRTNGIPSPETGPQTEQVRIVLDEMYHKNKDKMFTTVSIIFYRSKSKCFNLLRTITSSKQINIDIEIKKLNDRKEFVKALDLFDKQKHQTILTDRIVIQVLKACTQLGYLERGLIIHKNLSDSSLNSSYIQTTLIHFYVMQCGRVNDAQRVFDSSKNKTLIHYGAMMKGLIKNNMAEKAIELFSKITHPGEFQLCLLFSSCAHVRTKQALDFGKKVWSEMSSIHHRNKYILTSAFDMLVKCGDLENAENVFAKKNRTLKDYGQMMKCYNEHSLPMKTLDLYDKMKDEGIEANSIIFLLLIDACGQLGIESRCRSIVNQIPSTMLNDLKLQNALIHMWGKVGCVNEAKKVFEQIDQPDPVTYNSMINSYGLNGMGRTAVELYHRMPFKMIDEKTYTCILNACSHSGLVDEARTIFSTIQIKNKWIYTSMVREKISYY
ncbi:hypothetical protein I4U23_026969 [Adineta vaga]|nr:hypothetical protein I4U23_026969 [Adineta vaga]